MGVSLAEALIQKPAVSDVLSAWGARPEARRTEGTADRTYAMALIAAVKTDIEALGTPIVEVDPKTGAKRLVPDPDFAVPELGDLAYLLPNAWAGHGGRDNQHIIAMTKAATATVSTQAPQPTEDREP